MPNKKIRLSGKGGQGIILGGILLGEAAVIGGKEVVQTQSYGPEARGGASKAEVIISSKPILYPKIIVPNCLLLMSNEAVMLYARTIAEGGLIIMEKSLTAKLPEIKAIVKRIPLVRLAREEIGNELTTNIIAIGALAAAGEIVIKEALEEAVSNRLAKVADLNIRALRLGWERGLK